MKRINRMILRHPHNTKRKEGMAGHEENQAEQTV